MLLLERVTALRQWEKVTNVPLKGQAMVFPAEVSEWKMLALQPLHNIFLLIF